MREMRGFTGGKGPAVIDLTARQVSGREGEQGKKRVAVARHRNRYLCAGTGQELRERSNRVTLSDTVLRRINRADQIND